MVSFVGESASWIQECRDLQDDVVATEYGMPLEGDGPYSQLLNHADNLRRFVQNCENNLRVMNPEEFFSWIKGVLT